MITEVAERLGIDQAEFRLRNMYKQNDNSIYNTILADWHMQEMFTQAINDFDFYSKRNEIERFNADNKWKKRGLAIVPSNFKLGFSLKIYEQGSALVHIYTDGSVLIHTGGVEMGQGLNTKLIHLAANALEIPETQIYINETSTNTIPNAVATAASIATDLQGGALLNACEILLDRLRSFKESNPSGTLADWASAAFLSRVSLSATGFYKTNSMYDKETKTGTMFNYTTTGVAISMVELDVLTGDHTILRSDIIMDIGKSINYSVDVGQVEGAFVQGIGLFTCENLLHLSTSGALASKGPGTYKIPTAEDIPQEFNVKFLKDKEYKRLENAKKWKGVGEPPLQLAFSVFLALRDAVIYARFE